MHTFHTVIMCLKQVRHRAVKRMQRKRSPVSLSPFFSGASDVQASVTVTEMHYTPRQEIIA